MTTSMQYNAFRIGIGYDVHRLAPGRPLMLGGVEVPHARGLVGHSDADVLLHAITDALLGAAALGDIGHHFPDTDERWKGADSRDLLAQAAALVRETGYCVGNVDCTVALQHPKLHPYIEAMRRAVAETLSLEVGQVSVKATTTETLGFVGREEGVAAWAVCLIAPC